MSKCILSFKPTDEEIEQARQLLASATPAKRKSITNAMHTFARANSGSESSHQILLKSNDALEFYMMRYLCYQNAKSKGILHNRTNNYQQKAGITDEVPMCRFQLDKEFGDEKARTMVNGGLMAPWKTMGDEVRPGSFVSASGKR